MQTRYRPIDGYNVGHLVVRGKTRLEWGIPLSRESYDMLGWFHVLHLAPNHHMFCLVADMCLTDGARMNEMWLTNYLIKSIISFPDGLREKCSVKVVQN